uniref:O-acyltransferase WSD1 C-terminal domain-containing protein n=1 Tax=Solanum tuberosum TaxID=4113 RepID=M0ZGJ1_SOLTU
MRCRANVIVNLRPALGVQAIAEMIEKNVAVIQGNCFGFVLIPLSIGESENPLDYVHKAKTSMDRKKHSLESQCTFYASQLFLKLFGFKGIMVHVCSYANKLTFTIAVDEGIIPDLKQLGDDFIQSFMLIKEAAHHTKLATKLD